MKSLVLTLIQPRCGCFTLPNYNPRISSGAIQIQSRWDLAAGEVNRY